MVNAGAGAVAAAVVAAAVVPVVERVTGPMPAAGAVTGFATTSVDLIQGYRPIR